MLVALFFQRAAVKSVVPSILIFAVSRCNNAGRTAELIVTS
jgi:hypothetical protein